MHSPHLRLVYTTNAPSSGHSVVVILLLLPIRCLASLLYTYVIIEFPKTLR